MMVPVISEKRDSKIRLGANLIAFLAGVGTKIAFGAIEKPIETLDEK